MNYQATHLRALLGVMLAAVVLALLFGRPGPAAQHSWLPSTYNSGPSGLRGLYETLQEAHWPVGKWQENFLNLPPGQDEVMIITRSPYGRKALFSPAEIDRLWAWMEGGRTLLLMGNFAEWDDTRPFLEKTGRKIPPSAPQQNLFERSAAMLSAHRSTMKLTPGPGAPAAWSADHRQLEVVASPPIPNEAALQGINGDGRTNDLSALLKDGAGQPQVLWQSDNAPFVVEFNLAQRGVAGSAPLPAAPTPIFDRPRQVKESVPVVEGDQAMRSTLRVNDPARPLAQDGAGHTPAHTRGPGRLVLVASSSLFDNDLLRNPDNLWFLTQLLAPNGVAPAKVWFEEGHHGYRSSYAATDLLNQPGLRLAGVQVGLLVVLFLASQMVRFGQIVPLERGRQRATLEFVNSMATLYQRANLRNDCIESLYRETHRRVLRKLNLPEGTSHDIVARQLAEAFPRLPKWKKLAARFDRQDKDFVQGMAPGGWLKTAQDLVTIKNAMV